MDIDTASPSRATIRSPRRLVLAAAAAAAAYMATGWPVASLLAAAAALGLPVVFGRTAASKQAARIEAIATWTEMLRDTLAAATGLGQAIVTTAGVAPAAIANEVRMLADRLLAGISSQDALLGFASDLNDPVGDLVVCALLLSERAQGRKLADLLGSLADAARDEVAMRLRVETSRASVRSGVRAVSVFSVAFAFLLAIVGHSYLSVYNTPLGEIVLAAVGGLYACGLALMVWMARPPAPLRLLENSPVEPEVE
ncbi:MAG: type II secretion system F family protein [Actinobacteria bacterium]|nr:type II secretion system F family protein [Actinomycetota bacterium]